MYKRVSSVLGVATLVLAGCDGSPTGPQSEPCDQFLLSYGAVGADTVTTASGLRYIDVELGTGAAVTANSVALVNFSGYYQEEEAGPVARIDSSCVPGAQPIGFHVQSGQITGGGLIIEGFTHGVMGMKEQGVRRIIVPPELGFDGGFFLGKETIFDLHLVDAGQ